MEYSYFNSFLFYIVRAKSMEYSYFNSFLFYIVRKFSLILCCQQILIYYKLSASSTQQIHVSDSSILSKSEIVFILSANSLSFYIVRKSVSESSTFYIQYVRKFLHNIYCPQIPFYSILSANFFKMCIVSSRNKT